MRLWEMLSRLWCCQSGQSLLRWRPCQPGTPSRAQGDDQLIGLTPHLLSCPPETNESSKVGGTWKETASGADQGSRWEALLHGGIVVNQRKKGRVFRENQQGFPAGFQRLTLRADSGGTGRAPPEGQDSGLPRALGVL